MTRNPQSTSWWQSLRGFARPKYPAVARNHREPIVGRRTRLVGKARRIYGVSQREAEVIVDELLRAPQLKSVI